MVQLLLSFVYAHYHKLTLPYTKQRKIKIEPRVKLIEPQSILTGSIIDLITVLEAILTGRQTRFEITVLVCKSNVK